jgi:hypothetical protein
MKIKKSAILVTIFALAILSLPFQAGAVVNWTKDAANPVYERGDGASGWDNGEVERPMVIKDGSNYYMWYTGRGSGTTNYIGRTTSTDGINWTSGASVFWPSGSGWDSANVGYCWVIKSGTSYYMWYTGNDVPDEEENWQIGLATSYDGINWTRSGTSPVLEYGSGVSDWDRDVVGAPTVIYDTSGSSPYYKMWYVGFNDTIESEAIGYAESQDGINWTKHFDSGTSNNPNFANSTPVIFGGNQGAWDQWPFSPSVIKEGSVYRMWYDGETEIGDQGDEFVRIGYAYSLDGIHWTKYIGSPVILAGSPGDFDDPNALDPMVMKDGNTYKMWYVGESNCGDFGCDTAIGYATSPAYPQDAYLGIEAMSVSVFQNGWGLILMCLPEGPGPLDINELKVTGPNGFSYVFADSDIQNLYSNNRVWQFPGVGIHNSLLPGSISTGQYTFSITANSGVSVSDSLNLASTTGIPIPPDGTGAGQLDRHISGTTNYYNQSYIGTTTPTFKWKPCSGTTYYYRVMVNDWTTRAMWYLGDPVSGSQAVGGYMSDTIAAGTLKQNTPYKWRVEVLDTNNVWSANARSRSAYHDFYTGTKSGTSNFLMFANVTSQRSTSEGEKILPQVGVYNLAPWDIDTTTGGQEFRVEKSGGTPFSYLFDVDSPAYPVENDAITPGPDNTPFIYLPTTMMGDNFPYYFLSGFPEDGTYDFIVYENGTSNHDTRSIDFYGDTTLPIVERCDMTPNDNAYLNSNEPTLTWKSSGRWKWHRVMVVDWTIRRIAYISDYMDGVDAGQDMSITIPAGALSEYSPYRWTVEVYDENRQNRTRGSWLSFMTGEEGYNPGDELVVDFGVSGLWHFGGAWTNISSFNSELLENFDNALAADFGANGLWKYDGNWTKISALDAQDLEEYDFSLATDFGANGLWAYDGSWTRISTLDAQDLEEYGDMLAADFGATWGLWVYDGSWTRISTLDAQDLEEYGDMLAADFGATWGLWIWDGFHWTQISALDAEQMQCFGDTLAVDFGATYGLWIYNGSWTKISSLDAVLLEDYNGMLAADFGVTHGLWIYDGTWRKIPGSSESICTYGGNLAGDFGVMGLWSFDGFSWSKINDSNADNTGDTMTDFYSNQ